ncbi:hypothetical protein [Kutzneria sp. NPDC051319]
MSKPNHSPDGLTFEDITALEREVAEELRAAPRTGGLNTTRSTDQ